jgi:hypothetical protein
MSDECKRDRISFRLRNVDADLREATSNLSTEILSDLARDGLRLILGIRTTKRVEITERPINVRMITEEPATVKGKPSVFIPGQQRERGR